jgi:signal transduction histidine kinase
MARITVCLILLLFSKQLLSQRNRAIIDSFVHIEATATQDSDRLHADIKLCLAYLSINPDSFFLYSQKGMQLAKSLNRQSDMVLLNDKMADKLMDTGNYVGAMKYAQESLAISRSTNSKTDQVDAYTTIGRTYDYQSDYVHSAEFFYKAMDLAKELNDHNRIALLGTNLAALAYNQYDYKKAEATCLLTIREAQLAKNGFHEYKGYYILGLTKEGLGDTVSAEASFSRANEICKTHGLLIEQADVLSELGMVQKTDQDKLRLLLEARKLYDSLSEASFESMINRKILGDVYLRMYKADPTKQQFLTYAADYLTKVIAKSKDMKDVATESNAYESMAKVEVLRGNYQRAYDYNNRYHTINDSIFSQQNKNKIAELENKSEMDKQKQEVQTQKLRVSEQKKNVYLLMAGALLLGAFGFLFFRLSSIRKAKNVQLAELNRKLDDANNIKIKFFGILSHDLRRPIANLVNFIHLKSKKPGLLSAEEWKAHENRVSIYAKDLLETMDNMLLWSKSQMEQFTVETKPVPAARIFSVLKRNFGDNNDLQLIFTDPEEVIVQTDENILQTIMHNLTANSIKALEPANGGKIEWSVCKTNGEIVFSIRDNGPGIGDENLQALYSDAAIGSTKNGLGLHIIRDLAQAIHLTITRNPDRQEGTEFVLTLPA